MARVTVIIELPVKVIILAIINRVEDLLWFLEHDTWTWCSLCIKSLFTLVILKSSKLYVPKFVAEKKERNRGI